MTDTVCPCPEEYPDWHGQNVDLSGYFIHEMKISSVFHMPVAYDMYVSRQAENIQNLELEERWPGFILTKTGMFSGKIIRLLKDAQSASRLTRYLPGGFWVKAQMHGGGIGTVPKAAHKMQIAMLEDGLMPKELYLVHLTCDECWERKGGDKILILRRFAVNERIQANLKAENKKIAEKQAKKAARQQASDNGSSSVPDNEKSENTESDVVKPLK